MKKKILLFSILLLSFLFFLIPSARSQTREELTREIAELQEKLKDLRTKLLNYRCKTDAPPDLGNNFVLKGRIREIFESIIATGMHINVIIDDVINHAKEKAKKQEDELNESIQYEILSIIKKHQENPFFQHVLFLLYDILKT